MARKEKTQPTEQDTKLLQATASADYTVARNAMHDLAVALETPLRKGVLSGDITGGLFETIKLTENSTSDFPLDFLAPGTEKEFVAFCVPNHGRIPERHVEGDYVHVPTYDIANTIDWNLKYARDARWDVMSRAMEVLRMGFVKKVNDDAWQTILTAAYDRNITVFDSDANAGQFTKRLVSLGKTVMRRNGGGNSSSVNRGKLTDLYTSPEAIEDMRNWNIDQVDEVTRREIFLLDGEGSLNRVFGVNLHDLDELGEGQEYQDFITTDLGLVLPAADLEICVGLDLSKNDSFVMPVRQEIQVFEDPTFHRQNRASLYARMELGMAVLDNRRVMLLSF